MEKLLTNYSLSEILIFVCFLAAAIKGVVTFFDWAEQRLRQKFLKEDKIDVESQKFREIVDHEIRQREIDRVALQQQINEIKERDRQTFEALNQTISNLQTKLDAISKKTDILIDSDRDDIKAWITREHHYFVNNLGKIDSYSLDCIERRFKHYKDEKGNSFVESLIDEIRALPKMDLRDEKIEH